jgi:hypothetical protein
LLFLTDVRKQDDSKQDLQSAAMIDSRGEEREMARNRGGNIIIAVIFSATLIMGSGAEASSLFAIGGDPAPAAKEIGFFEQAVQWLNGAWNDLTSVFAASQQTPPPPPTPTECTTNCGDAGPGIDPLG